MKQPPNYQDLRTLLGPSKFAADGYLGNDTRSVEEIIAEDLAYIEQAGVTREDLLQPLRAAYKKAVDALGDPIELLPGVIAVHYESRGKIPSPFRNDGFFQKGEVVVTDSKGGKQLIITLMGINLIEKHDFFQGRGSRYRIEPADIVTVFNLQN